MKLRLLCISPYCVCQVFTGIAQYLIHNQGAINTLSTLMLIAEAAASARGRLDGAKRGRLWYTAVSLQSKSCWRAVQNAIMVVLSHLREMRRDGVCNTAATVTASGLRLAAMRFSLSVRVPDYWDRGNVDEGFLRACVEDGVDDEWMMILPATSLRNSRSHRAKRSVEMRSSPGERKGLAPSACFPCGSISIVLVHV